MPGRLNQITDVHGVSVGHFTLKQGNIQTGVTAILPYQGNCFREKCVAAAHVINGFGKSVGLMQIQELGTLETPVILTNTFAVGTASTALIRYMLANNPDIGVTTGSVNPVVMECNDSNLNDIRGMHITEEHVMAAIAAAEEREPGFEEGAVGAGTGMSCYGLKGGIGSASRIIPIDHHEYTLGVLALTNFGKLEELVVYGDPVGRKIASARASAAASEESERGSVIVLIATDMPLTARQLGRAARRAQNGLARTGTITGNGSGDIVLAFSTANKVSHYPERSITHAKYLHEDYLDKVFAAVTETVEESVISSLTHAETNELIQLV